MNFDQQGSLSFDKTSFFENLVFYVDVVYNKTNETENYKNLILEYGGQVNFMFIIWLRKLNYSIIIAQLIKYWIINLAIFI